MHSVYFGVLVFVFFFSCLQPVQNQVEPSAAEEACVESCLIQAQACGQDRDCSSQCGNIVQQLTTGGCLDLAQEMWSCHQQIAWTCVQEQAESTSDQCQEQEDAYLGCFAPEDTGSVNY